jgi:hypothetical protein
LRIWLLMRSPLDPGHVSSDQKVLVYSLDAHLVRLGGRIGRKVREPEPRGGG